MRQAATFNGRNHVALTLVDGLAEGEGGLPLSAMCSRAINRGDVKLHV